MMMMVMISHFFVTVARPVILMVCKQPLQMRTRHVKREEEKKKKVDRVLANLSLVSTASLFTSNISFAWFLVLRCNRQAQRIESSKIRLPGG